MKVGMIGLGRMGEGMSRRMIKEGIEVYGYRRNYLKDIRVPGQRLRHRCCRDMLEELVKRQITSW